MRPSGARYCPDLFNFCAGLTQYFGQRTEFSKIGFHVFNCCVVRVGRRVDVEHDFGEGHSDLFLKLRTAAVEGDIGSYRHIAEFHTVLIGAFMADDIGAAQ